MKPLDARQLSEAVRAAAVPFEVFGTGTKPNLGRPVDAAPLNLSAFNRVIAYEPEELILECGSATRLAFVQKLLKKHNQMLAFEPPDFSTLLRGKHSGTIGGALMCNISGPRRIKAGAARDHILGVSGVNGRGDFIKAGARVVKNVTGYDVPRLVAGSYGTLMALTSVIFKVLPKPETEMTLQVKCKTPIEAVTILSRAMRSAAEVSSAAFVPGQGAYLRLEGFPASVLDRRDTLIKALAAKSECLAKDQSQNLWAALRDVGPLWTCTSQNIWRISVPPSDAPDFLAALKIDFTYFLDWAGGLIWLACKPQGEASAIRGAVKQGHAMLFRASEQLRSTTDVFQPQPKDLVDLNARVKHAFDPKGLFNPGRMYKAV
jgi:glycolate oxidase FAD binding subunit